MYECVAVCWYTLRFFIVFGQEGFRGKFFPLKVWMTLAYID